MKSRLAEELMAYALKQAELGTAVGQLRRHFRRSFTSCIQQTPLRIALPELK